MAKDTVRMKETLIELTSRMDQADAYLQQQSGQHGTQIDQVGSPA
jgi:hypothetical protein